jgi:hypothetical protein
MTDDPRLESLNEWNKLSRENTENAIVSSMFEASSIAVAPIETFSTWLLVGAAAIASFQIGNADKLLPIIGSTGYLLAGLLLCASCVFGLLSKIFALRGTIGRQIGVAIKTTVFDHLRQHEENAAKIQAQAETLGITIETDIRMERVLHEFMAPLPWWARWAVARTLKRHAGSHQIEHISQIKNLNAQGVWAFLQSMAFLAFLLVGIIFAATI